MMDTQHRHVQARLVVGISSRALFDLEEANAVFERQGVEAYRAYQREHEEQLLGKGAAFHLAEALLHLNRYDARQRLVEVIIMSRNSPDTGLRIFKSIEHYGLDITRTAFTGGDPLAPYLAAYEVDLFLSKFEDDVQDAIDNGFAAAQIYPPPPDFEPDRDQIRIAFDADAVVFSEESERIFKQNGLAVFVEHERRNAREPMAAGPFARLLRTLAYLQNAVPDDRVPVRLAIVTARNSPAHERVIRTLRAWNVNVDEAFFLGGLPKDEVLRAFRAHIFFDDQHVHVERAARQVPSGKVPYKRGSPLHRPAAPAAEALPARPPEAHEE